MKALDEAALSAAILANLPAVLRELHDYTGRPSGDVLDLNRAASPKRLGEFTFSPYSGAWMNRSTGDRGDNAVDLVMWAGSCERDAAVNLLQRIVARLPAKKAA
jgi:hypothetical protein